MFVHGQIDLPVLERKCYRCFKWHSQCSSPVTCMEFKVLVRVYTCIRIRLLHKKLEISIESIGSVVGMSIKRKYFNLSSMLNISYLSRCYYYWRVECLKNRVSRTKEKNNFYRIIDEIYSTLPLFLFVRETFDPIAAV